MALLSPVPWSGYPAGTGNPPLWGPTTKTAEPPGWGYLGRFWYSYQPSPFRKYAHYHPALDEAAKLGAPIYASETGIITAVGPNPLSPASGIRYNVRIRPSPNVVYGGGHCSSIAKNPATGRTWRVGEKIKRGQVIAYIGQTGNATGPHVHWFVQIGSMLYDPRLFLPGGFNANDWRIKPVY